MRYALLNLDTGTMTPLEVQTGPKVRSEKEAQLVAMISAHGSISIAALSRQLNITRSAVRTRLLKAEQRGLITKDADNKWSLATPTDSRA